MHGLSGHAAPHVFHFYKNTEAKPEMCNKPYHCQGEWSMPYQLLPIGIHPPTPPSCSPVLLPDRQPSQPPLHQVFPGLSHPWPQMLRFLKSCFLTALSHSSPLSSRSGMTLWTNIRLMPWLLLMLSQLYLIPSPHMLLLPSSLTMHSLASRHVCR